MPDPLHIKCADCGHENEPERVYCHNCGAKLDRSLLPKPEDKKNFETPDATRRRVTRMMNPQGSWVKRDFKALVKVLIFAAVVAALFLFWVPPENMPAATEGLGDYILREQWNRQIESPAPSVLEYTEADTNRFLKTLKGGEGVIPGIKFKSAVVKFSPGVVTLFVERDAWGLCSLWSSVDYRPVMKDGKLVPQVIGVHYGRLGIHPSATFAHQWGVEAVLKTLERDFGKWDRIQSVQVEEGRLIVTTKL
jgi:hypothetical protein